MKKKIKTIKLKTPTDRKPSLLSETTSKKLFINLSEEGLKRFTYFFPFIAGALLVERFKINNFQLFTLYLALVALAYHCANSLYFRDSHSAPNYKFSFYYGAAIILILLQYYLTSDPTVAIITITFLGLTIVRGIVAFKSPAVVIIGALCLVCELTIISILGVYSQEQKLSETVLKVGILGFVPGCVMAAATFIENLNVFEKNGWQRSMMRTNRKGIEIRRPRGISQWYSLLLVIGPIIAISGVFFKVTNNAPFGYLITIFFAAKLSQAFFEEILDPKDLLLKTLRLAALTAALGLPIGLFASA